MTPLPELLTTGAAADHMGVSVGTVRRWAKAGHLRHVVMPSGRLKFRPEDLDGAVRGVEPSNTRTG
jgi:excisionase family DNA binding protein